MTTTLDINPAVMPRGGAGNDELTTGDVEGLQRRWLSGRVV